MTYRDRYVLIIGLCVGFLIGVLLATAFWFLIIEEIAHAVPVLPPPTPVIDGNLAALLRILA